MQYLDMTLEKLTSFNKVVYLMDDFNIDLLKSEISDLSHNFLLSIQSYSFFPVIDKPTRVYNNSATLIDNIFVNRSDHRISGGNIVSDISDHYSHFCSSTGLYRKILLPSAKFAIIPTFLKNALLKMSRNLTGITQWQTDLYTKVFLPFITNLTKFC